MMGGVYTLILQKLREHIYWGWKFVQAAERSADEGDPYSCCMDASWARERLNMALGIYFLMVEFGQEVPREVRGSLWALQRAVMRLYKECGCWNAWAKIGREI